MLGHDDFDADDSFFTVGGNSLRVVELHKCFERDWPGAIRVGQLFDLDTVAAQAEAMAAAITGGPAGTSDRPATGMPGGDVATPGEQR